MGELPQEVHQDRGTTSFFPSAQPITPTNALSRVQSALLAWNEWPVCRQNRWRVYSRIRISKRGVRQTHGTLALQEVAIRCSWFDPCVSNVQFYDLADDFNAQFIVDGVTQARKAFERRVDMLRQQLLDAGWITVKVDEIIGQQKFLEHVTQATLPKAAD